MSLRLCALGEMRQKKTATEALQSAVVTRHEVEPVWKLSIELGDVLAHRWQFKEFVSNVVVTIEGNVNSRPVLVDQFR